MQMMPPYPDPPREPHDASDPPEDNQIVPPNIFVPVWDEADDIFGNEDDYHALDIDSGGEESDFSDSGNEDGPVPSSQGQIQEEEGETDNSVGEATRVRGRYQLLIPFPAGDSTTDVEYVADNQIHSTSVVASTSNTNTISQVIDGEQEDVPALNNLNEPVQQASSNNTETEQRDINLTPENVDVIKTVMKNFTLSPAAIPPWAEELSDDALKNRLSQSVSDRKSKSSDKK